jgi:hypothetical protein
MFVITALGRLRQEGWSSRLAWAMEKTLSQNKTKQNPQKQQSGGNRDKGERCVCVNGGNAWYIKGKD